MSTITNMGQKTTQLNQDYFQTYLEKLPENRNKKFSYDPYASKLPQFLSFTNLFCTIFTGGLFLIAYPIAYTRDFWKARQVKLNTDQVRQNAIATLKQEVNKESLIQILAVGIIAAEEPEWRQELLREEEEEGNSDIAGAIREDIESYNWTEAEMQKPLEKIMERANLEKGIDYLADKFQGLPGTLFLEMATQRLPAQLRQEALNHVNNLYGSNYTQGNRMKKLLDNS